MRARVIKDVQEIKLVDRRIGPFTSGQEVELEQWEVKVLRHHGLVEPVQTLAELRKILLMEERAFELYPLPENFYSAVIDELAYLRATNEFEKTKEIQSAVNVLVELRIHKLLRSTLSPSEVKLTTPEEKFLFNRLSADVNEWTGQMVRRFERGDEVGKNGEFGGNIQNVVGDETDIQKPRISSPDVHARGIATS